MPQTELDLNLHILYVAFYNRFIKPQAPISTQELMVRLMVSYPHIFHTTHKISYAISTLKTQGYIVEGIDIDKDAYAKCVETVKQKHSRKTDSKIRKECMSKVGYRSILIVTELGVAQYCDKVKKVLVENKHIERVCREYESKPLETA
jgi:hypothetical protein